MHSVCQQFELAFMAPSRLCAAFTTIQKSTSNILPFSEEIILNSLITYITVITNVNTIQVRGEP